MNKILKRILIVVAILGALGYGAYQFLIYQTKQQSPEQISVYEKGNYDLEVFYNRPSKKGRNIFGGLVPYNYVWRTGANEATTFKTKTNLTIDGQNLPADKYTLWTIPGPDSWKIIFNKKQYSWGIKSGGVSREPEFDVLSTEVPVESLPNVVELFTIDFSEEDGKPVLYLSWDQTKVSILMQ